jgi:hypothetical protein
MVTLVQTVSVGGSQRPASSGASLWRMGIAGRFAMAAGAIVLLWSAIALGLS